MCVCAGCEAGRNRGRGNRGCCCCCQELVDDLRQGNPPLGHETGGADLTLPGSTVFESLRHSPAHTLVQLGNPFFRWMRFSLMLDQSSGPSSLLPSQRRSLRGSPWRETSPPATLEWDMFNCEGSGSAADLLCLPTLNLSCFFVRISSMKEDAETAMKDLKNKPFKGQTLHLTLAKPKPKSELFLRNQLCLGPTFSPPISPLSPLQPRRRRMVLKLQRYQSPSR